MIEIMEFKMETYICCILQCVKCRMNFDKKNCILDTGRKILGYEGNELS